MAPRTCSPRRCWESICTHSTPRRTLAARVGVGRRARGAVTDRDEPRHRSIHIDAPPEDVWQLVMDAQRLGDWVTIHRGLGHADDGPSARRLPDGSAHPPARCQPRRSLDARRVRPLRARGMGGSRTGAIARTHGIRVASRRTAARGLITATSFALRSARSARSSAGRWSAESPSGRPSARSSGCAPSWSS